MDKTLELLKKSNALLEGHFLLSSGKHSDRYIQCAKLIANPDYCEEVAKIIKILVNTVDIYRVEKRKESLEKLFIQETSAR